MTNTRILIVEDERIVALHVQNALLAMGYTVVGIAASAVEAIRKTAEARPDLVLMDIKLPGEMDGTRAAEQVRQRFDIPVVYLTAFADRDTLMRAKLSGPFGYVLKPFEEKDLQATIEMALYKHDMDRKLRESEQWLAAMLKCLGDAVIATDANGLIKFMNHVAEQLTGWLEAEVVGRELPAAFRVINEETRRTAENPVAQALRDEAQVGPARRTVMVARDGTERPIEQSVAPIKDGSGKMIGVVLAFRDVSDHWQVEDALQRYALRLTTLHAIDKVILTAQSPEEIAQAALRNVCRSITCLWANVVLFDLDANEAVVLAEQVYGGQDVRSGMRTALEAQGVAPVLHQGQVHLVPDILALAQRTHTDAQLLARGIRSYVNVPLISQGELMGTLNLGAGSPNAFSGERMEIARQVADQLAVAIRQIRLREQVERHARELAALNKAGQAVASTLDLQVVVKLVLDEARKLLEAEGVSVLLCESASNECQDALVFAAATGLGTEALIGTRIPATAGIAGWVLKERTPTLVSDVSSDPRFYGGVDELTRLKTRSIMAVPLMARGAVLGVIEVTNKVGGTFRQHDLDILETMASSAAAAIDNARLYESEKEQRHRLQQAQAQLVQPPTADQFPLQKTPGKL